MVSFLLPLRQALAALALVALASNYVVVSASQVTTSDVCANGLPSNLQCFSVENNWDIFRSSINTATDGEVIRFCPFLITKVGTLPATPVAFAAFACSVPGACVIRGPGRHILIQDHRSETLFYGFVFQNATDTAVRIAANATKTQSLCRLYFEE